MTIEQRIKRIGAITKTEDQRCYMILVKKNETESEAIKKYEQTNNLKIDQDNDGITFVQLM